MAANPYSNVSISGYNLDAPTDDGAQTANNRVTWAKQKTKLADPLKVAIEAIDNATDDAFAAVAAILVDFTGDFGSGGITGLVPAPGAGDAANNRFLRADGTWTTPAGAGSVTSVATGSGLTGGPITGAGTISLASIANNAVMGNLTGLTAAPSAILLPALLNAFDVFQGDLGSGGVKGLVPAPAAGEDAKFLRGDGTWAATVDNYSGTVTSITAGSGLSGGAITTSGTISLASISNTTVLGNISGSAGVPTETDIANLTPYLSAFGGDFGSGGAKGLVPAPAAGDAAAGRFLKADGSWSVPPGGGGGGGGDLLAANNLSELTATATTARTNLGIGTGDSPQFTGINVGHATDTTITRTGAGAIAVEGVGVALNSTSLVHTASTIELGHASDTTISRASAGQIAVEGVNVAMNSTSATHTAGTIELGAASDTTLSRASAGRMAVEGVTLGITMGTAVASTSGTSIDFTSIPTWAKKITISFVGVSTNGSSNPLIQIGDSGGVETTGYLGAGSNIVGAATSSANYTTGFGLNGSLAANVLHGQLTLCLVDASANTWTAAGFFSLSSAAASILTAGSKSLSATLDRVRITTVGGADTFDAGTINIMYEG